MELKSPKEVGIFLDSLLPVRSKICSEESSDNCGGTLCCNIFDCRFKITNCDVFSPNHLGIDPDNRFPLKSRASNRDRAPIQEGSNTLE